MWYFDGSAGPGWYDYLGLAISIAGFWIAIDQINRNRAETKKATKALGTAQKHLSQRAIMSVVPQLQTVVNDLAYALSANDAEVAQRTLIRFSLIAREASGLLTGMDGSHETLSLRLVKASDKATKAKGELVTTVAPDVILLVKGVSSDIDKLSQDLTELAATLRNTIEGVANV